MKMLKNLLIQFLLFILILTFTITSCKDKIVEPKNDGEPKDENLLSNGSFEINNQPSLDGWYLGSEELVELINQAAPDGGEWSLQLTGDWIPTSGFVYTPVTNIESGDIVTLSAFVRATGQLGGGISLVIGQNISSEYRKSISSNDTIWNKISVIDTLNFTQNDTVWVVLSAQPSQLALSQMLFDLVRLEKRK